MPVSGFGVRGASRAAAINRMALRYFPAMADFFWLYAPSAADLDYKPYCCAQVMDPAEMN